MLEIATLLNYRILNFNHIFHNSDNDNLEVYMKSKMSTKIVLLVLFPYIKEEKSKIAPIYTVIFVNFSLNFWNPVPEENIVWLYESIWKTNFNQNYDVHSYYFLLNLQEKSLDTLSRLQNLRKRNFFNRVLLWRSLFLAIWLLLSMGWSAQISILIF